jgi:hypothetical protein
MVTSSSAQGNMTRRRPKPTKSVRHEIAMNSSNNPYSVGRLAACILPHLLAALAMLSLIFGGCCSNVCPVQLPVSQKPGVLARL